MQNTVPSIIYPGTWHRYPSIRAPELDLNNIPSKNAESLHRKIQQKTHCLCDIVIFYISTRPFVFNSRSNPNIVSSAQCTSNAVKYSPAATPVEITVASRGRQLQVEGRDYGIGIAPEDIPFIFNRYFHVKDISHSHQGMGIGLYLSATIVHRHDGKIWVESEKGKGSRFYFVVPLQQR